MNYLIVILMVSTAAIFGCSRKPKDLKAQQSYSIGVSFGKSLKAQKLELDKKALANGVEDGFEGKEIQLSDQDMQQSLQKLSESRQADQKASAEKNKAQSDEFIAKNREAEGVKVTASGLQYKVIQEGAGPSPKPEEVVVVNYRGTLVDGTEFDSSYKRKEPTEFPVRGVIPGWQEGLQMMKKGGKMMFYLPELGYGAQARQQIPANATLIFEVELLDIKPPPKPAGSPPAHIKPMAPKAAKGK